MDIEKTKTLHLHEKHREKVRKGIARYLLVRCIIIVHSSFGLEFLYIHLQDNSQMHEQWLTLKCEEDRKIRSSLTHRLGTVPLLHVVCYIFVLVVYFNFPWAFFPKFKLDPM